PDEFTRLLNLFAEIVQPVNDLINLVAIQVISFPIGKVAVAESLQQPERFFQPVINRPLLLHRYLLIHSRASCTLANSFIGKAGGRKLKNRLATILLKGDDETTAMAFVTALSASA